MIGVSIVTFLSLIAGKTEHSGADGVPFTLRQCDGGEGGEGLKVPGGQGLGWHVGGVNCSYPTAWDGRMGGLLPPWWTVVRLSQWH